MSQNNLALQHLLAVVDAPVLGERARNNNNHNPLWNMRERLFHVLFERVTVAYASAIPVGLRKCIEVFLLIFAVVSLLVLAYIHVVFIQYPVNCLEPISNDWPRDGILRVEIVLSDSSHDFVQSSYENANLHAFKKGDETDTSEQLFENKDNVLINGEIFLDQRSEEWHDSSVQPLSSEGDELAILNNDTLYSDISPPVDDCTSPLRTPTSEMEMFAKAVWPKEEYIVEYSLEYGFLKLSSSARQKINIPIQIVTLDPETEKCFGNAFSRMLLKYIVGYGDVLMSSLKNLVDKDENKGFVRNVVTGDQYRFVNKSMTWTSYLAAAFIMMVFLHLIGYAALRQTRGRWLTHTISVACAISLQFWSSILDILCKTLSISMLLRYSHHQIFLFIVELLHVLEFNLNASFPAAPLLTVVLALVVIRNSTFIIGVLRMEAIMSEFFNDTTTAFYIILIVWVADQYDTICCHTSITKRHWLRFFYLYHFAFYAYDYRFNGQYSGLALFTSWLFVQHSMIYFFHHYELPAMQHHSENPDIAQDLHAENELMPSTNNSAQVASIQEFPHGEEYSLMNGPSGTASIQNPSPSSETRSIQFNNRDSPNTCGEEINHDINNAINVENSSIISLQSEQDGSMCQALDVGKPTGSPDMIKSSPLSVVSNESGCNNISLCLQQKCPAKQSATSDTIKNSDLSQQNTVSHQRKQAKCKDHSQESNCMFLDDGNNRLS